MVDGGKSFSSATDTSDGCPAGYDALRAAARAAAQGDARLLGCVVATADREPAGFDADEVAFALVWSQATARDQVEFGRYLQQVIKPVWAALCTGDLDITRARIFHQMLLAVDADIAFTIAADLVDRAGGWTTTQLRDRLRRAVLKADPDGAVKRTARTVAQRRVEMAPEYDGVAALYGLNLPAARAVAAFERVDAIARARRTNGATDTLDQLRADTFLDLLEGIPVDTVPVQRRGVVEIVVPWSTVDGGTEPATLAGFGPIDAAASRSLLHELVGRTDTSWRYRIIDEHGQLLRHGLLPSPRTHADLASLRRHIPRPAGDATPRPPVEPDPRVRRPGPALSRWIKARDGTCRAPGCRTRAQICDLDHTTAHHHGGLTTHDNLTLACRHHHRLKHEAGWTVTQPQPGILTWHSPHGHVYYRTPDND